MDPQIPTSFIPKRPVSSEPVLARSRNRATGLLSLITTIVVIATIASFAFVYLYQKTLESKQVQVSQSINDARDGIGTDFLADMKRLNSRIEGVKLLIQNHIVVTPIFQALQQTTLRSVQYKSFSYDFTYDQTTKAQSVMVTLTGSAKSYNTIALQSDAFAASPVIHNPVFSNLTIDDKTGNVNFKLTFAVAAQDLSYQSFIDGVNSSNTQTTVQPQSL